MGNVPRARMRIAFEIGDRVDAEKRSAFGVARKCSMRNNAFLFFGGIATAAVLQFATAHNWRANPTSEVRADEMAYSANDDGESRNSQSEENRAARGRRRIRVSADGSARGRYRADDSARRDEEPGEVRNVGR